MPVLPKYTSTLLAALVLSIPAAHAWIEYPDTGTASMTHYTLGSGTVAACGCVGGSADKYPTAAMSQMAYGSSQAYGPACGRCFNLTLLNTYTPTPPFHPDESKSLVVKVTDLCPLSDEGWCSGTEDRNNSGGQNINFDLAYPSSAIPEDFFPHDEEFYGYKDFGVWNISYQAVDCSQWAGYDDEWALGSVSNLGPESVCCPDNPTDESNTCPSYSDDNGLAPDTTTSAADLSLKMPFFACAPLSFLFAGIVSYLAT